MPGAQRSTTPDDRRMYSCPSGATAAARSSRRGVGPGGGRLRSRCGRWLSRVRTLRVRTLRGCGLRGRTLRGCGLRGRGRQAGRGGGGCRRSGGARRRGRGRGCGAGRRQRAVNGRGGPALRDRRGQRNGRARRERQPDGRQHDGQRTNAHAHVGPPPSYPRTSAQGATGNLPHPVIYLTEGFALLVSPAAFTGQTDQPLSSRR